MLQHTFTPEHTRIDKGSMKHDWALFKDGISMSTNLVILGQPPGRALFNVKSRTLRILTMVSCWWRLNVVAMAIPLFFSFSFFYIEQDARTSTNSKTRYGLRKKLTSGYSHTSHTLGVCKTPSVWSSSLLLFFKAYRGVVVGVAHMFVGVVYLSFSLIFPWNG